ncbi:hypothetical protein [Paucisalibacillus sp. EB02]|uniref:hypothetical protein n=1 Tax=Paucisalibacillus sp. EB02 TaxID=1347087 RepID=UPI0004BCD932|nr:hypothetical protein [Paucisalibacillus sp. EB02]
MCGITGIVDLRNFVREKRDILADITDSLTTRGSANVWFSTFVGFGYKGVKGDGLVQKKANGNMYAIAFSGNLDNIEDVSKKLLEKGHTFQNFSEAEVALTAYIESKENCLTHLDGNFIFTVWDDVKQELFMTCFQYGPLYYFQHHSLLLFGTDKNVLEKYHTVTPQSIRELRAGHSMIFFNKIITEWDNLDK